MEDKFRNGGPSAFSLACVPGGGSSPGERSWAPRVWHLGTRAPHDLQLAPLRVMGPEDWGWKEEPRLSPHPRESWLWKANGGLGGGRVCGGVRALVCACVLHVEACAFMYLCSPVCYGCRSLCVHLYSRVCACVCVIGVGVCVCVCVL